jgi:SAM-dependent methyltransferase
MEKQYRPEHYWNQLCGQEMKLSEVGWPQWTEAYNTYRYKLSLEQISRVLDTLNIEPQKILEVGCGIGFWTRFLSSRFQNSDYIGVDISKKAIENLQRQYEGNPRVRFQCSDISTPPHFPYKYDLIICLEVLLHIVDNDLWKKAIHHMSQSLSPGGYILISDPLNIHGEPPPYKLGDHDRVRKLEDFKHCLSEEGLEIVKIYPRTFFLDANCDFSSTWTRNLWNRFFRVYNRLLSIKWEPLGHAFGYPAYLFDKWYTSSERMGHSCKLIVVKRAAH